MHLYTSLNPEIAGHIANVLGVTLVTSQADADLVLLFPGFSGEIVYSQKSMVIAGAYSQESLIQAQNSKKAGVAAERILFTPDEQIDIKDLQDLIQPFIPVQAQMIGVVSVKGGVGKTTIATSLVSHYNTFSQKSVLVDVCSPCNAHYHLSSGEIVAGLSTLDDLRDKYQRIVVDLPHHYYDYSIFDRVVVVVDSDLVQCIRPSENILCDVVVYNRFKEEVPIEIVRQVFKCPVIKITEDHMGCAAALTGGKVTSSCSEVMANAVGQLAAEIDRRSMNAQSANSRTA